MQEKDGNDKVFPPAHLPHLEGRWENTSFLLCPHCGEAISQKQLRGPGGRKPLGTVEQEHNRALWRKRTAASRTRKKAGVETEKAPRKKLHWATLRAHNAERQRRHRARVKERLRLLKEVEELARKVGG
jgi:hypothetical protein